VSPAIELDWLGVDLRIREPAGEPRGALILNHGRAADENDLHGLLDAIDPDRALLGVTTGAPWRGLPPGGRHWYVVERVGYPHPETFGRAYAALGERLDSLLAERGLDWSQALVGGFSQGTVMSYAIGLGAGRPVPAGILANSGFIPEVEGWSADLEGRRDLPVLIHHGAADPVISVEFARSARERLEGAGLSPVYRETAAGHWLPPEIVTELRDFAVAALDRGHATA
jgi:phospholipase/carboxylesterase